MDLALHMIPLYCLDDLHRGSTKSLISQVVRLSRMYESAAAYVTDQPAFINAAVAVQTSLQPEALLRALKEIEVT